MDNFAAHMFTEAVQAEQDLLGVRDKFQHFYRNRLTGPLDPDTRAFIETRTSIYLATVSETGWPYIQHRGGPAGFLKVLDDDTLGFADYRGNKQVISKGNLNGSDKVSLFAMNYPRRARLKMIGRATMIEASQDGELAQRLAVAGQGGVERLTTIKLTAIDWNCPKYIEPRYTEVEIDAMLGPKIQSMATEIEQLRAELSTYKDTSK